MAEARQESQGERPHVRTVSRVAPDGKRLGFARDGRWSAPGAARDEPLAGAAVLQELPEVLARVRGGDLGDRLGRPFGDELPARVAALGAEIEDPVGALDHVEMVLDHEHGVARVDQAVEDAEQLADIVEVEPGGGLVEDVEVRPRSRRAASSARDLEPLGLAAGQGGGGLAEAEVAEPDVLEDLEPPRAAPAWRRRTGWPRRPSSGAPG